MSSVSVTNAPLMRPRPYKNAGYALDDDALPPVAVKERHLYSTTEVENVVNAAVDDVENRTLSDEEKTWKKRYGDLRKYEQEKSTKFTKDIAELKSQLATIVARDTNSLPKNEADVEKWAKEFPEVHNIVRAVASKEQTKQIEALQAQINQLKTDNMVSETQKALAILRADHPDLDELQGSEDFHAWIKLQPKKFQDSLFEELDPHAASKVLSMYKLEKGVAKPAVKPRVNATDRSAAQAVTTRGSAAPSTDAGERTITESWVRSLKPYEFDKYSDMIDKARADGSFVYDLSKR